LRSTTCCLKTICDTTREKLQHVDINSPFCKKFLKMDYSRKNL
jgi:hypothetical protein